MVCGDGKGRRPIDLISEGEQLLEEPLLEGWRHWPRAEELSAAYLEQLRRVVERLRAQARKLAQTPGIGRSRKDLRPDLFSFPVGRHVLFTAPSRAGSCSCA